MISNQTTISKMNELRLHGMAEAFRNILETGMNEKFTPDEMLAQLVDTEWNDRSHRKRERLRKAANFRYQASFEEIDFDFKRNLDKNLMLRLSDGSWIKEGKDILITGPTGVGKSYIGSALGHAACDMGYKVYYQLANRFFGQMAESKRSGNYMKLLTKYYKTDLLILEDFGLSPFDHESRLALLDILEDRHGRKSTILISQLPVSLWHGLVGDTTIADAVMDRIVYSSVRFELDGPSMRKKMYQKP